SVPVVVRFEGNNAALGVKALSESDVDIVAATGLVDAVEQAVKAAGGAV
ncbi:MAG: succinate--CoA ligase subunit beta, partial [Gammaproteobacteria bacterium]|nr:succinate--CoA ligase subunit beta [Gammaproteobacteria bacterium]